MKTLIDLSKVFRPIAKRRTRCCNEWFLVFAQLHDWFEGIDEPLNPSKFSSNSQKRDFFFATDHKIGLVTIFEKSRPGAISCRRSISCGEVFALGLPQMMSPFTYSSHRRAEAPKKG